MDSPQVWLDKSLARKRPFPLLAPAVQSNPGIVILIINIIIRIIIVIISTRPKPAYGRQGLAGFWGQDTDQAGSFWGVLNVSLRAYGAQLGFKPTRKMKNHKKQPGITKHLHGTMNNHSNYLEPKITIKFHL